MNSHPTLLVTQRIQLLTPDDCWFRAPSERASDFFSAYAPAARALQRTLRELLPPMMLASGRHFNSDGLAYSLLVYGASRPQRARPRAEFHYDVLDCVSMDRFFRLAKPGLRRSLVDLSEHFSATGREDLALRYHPQEYLHMIEATRRLRRHRKPLYQMLVTDELLFNELVGLGDHPYGSSRERTNLIATFNRRWNSLLNRFCLKFDFTAAAPALLRAATEAMKATEQPYELEQLAA